MALTRINSSLLPSSSSFNSSGVGTSAPSTTGELRATNQITAYYSDERLKTKIADIEGALEKVLQLHGFLYTENDTAKQLGFDNDEVQVALSAQDVLKVQPEAIRPAPFDVGQNSDGSEYSISGQKYLTVQYDRLVPLLVEAIKELKREVDSIKAGG